MHSLSVTESLPPSYKQTYHASLYNTQRYLEANNGLPQKHFFLVDESNQQVIGHVAFSLEEGEAMSPFNAPFGGFELGEGVDSTTFLFFLSEVQRRLKTMSVRFVRMQIAADCYEPMSRMMVTDMQHAGFIEKGKRLNHAIEVNEQPLSEKVKTMEKRRLQKAAKGGLTFVLAKQGDFTTYFDFIQRHREAKGHVLSMNRHTLREAIKASPEHYLMAGVYKEDQLIGASILVKVSARVIYNFFPAHDAAFNAWSPMVFLLEGVYIWCQQAEVAWLDLGTSYLGKQPNKTLIAFKEHMAGQPFESVILRKTLS